ncbi:YueI family protein [Natroniella sulfidigena]|uniref:YueI family protein n=1 Tax=Natroniella sulfidigena TaxID=723921 RepID=UPI00200B5C5A|nr:YueI family protein [Natroniella sulfidigena]MCK8816389.1 YueI family protein [Natroniella sulfidigena]
MSKEKDLQQEAIKGQQGKSELERKVGAEAHGGLELKKEERNQYLGQFKERVLKALTFAQVEEEGIYPEIISSIKDPEAKKLIIDSRVSSSAAKEYVEIARENDLSFKKVNSPEFKGEVGLVVVSDQAVNKEDIHVENRKKKLKEKGIPEELINAQGQAICSECYELLEERAPEELQNYQKITWVDKLIGKNCPGAH